MLEYFISIKYKYQAKLENIWLINFMLLSTEFRLSKKKTSLIKQKNKHITFYVCLKYPSKSLLVIFFLKSTFKIFFLLIFISYFV